MSSEVWVIQDVYESNDDPNDIQFGRGSLVKYSVGSMVNSASMSGSNYNFTSASGSIYSASSSQAVIKITGHKYSAGALKAHVDYISRDGNIEIENEQGDLYTGNKNDKSFSEWTYDFDARKETQFEQNAINKRLASSFVFSSPEGTDTDALVDSVREFAQKNFAGHRYVFAAHTPDTEVDSNKLTKNPHVHLVIENISPGKDKALKTSPEILRSWRRKYAEISKSNGIQTVQMEVGRKPAPHEKDQNIYRMLKKGIIPDKYKDHYETAKNRVERGDTHLTDKEANIINRAKSEFINRQRQIDDLKQLIDKSSNGHDKLMYAKQLSYLKQVNSSIKMPASNSQMFMKHALEQNDRRAGKGSKTFNSVPTIKHYMYAEKLAKAHSVDLPAGSNVSVKRLSNFVKTYGNKATPKYISLIKAVAKDRGITVYEDDISSHKAAMKWMANNKDVATIQQLAQANKLSKSLSLDLPEKLDSPSLKAFISKHIKQPSEQMVSFANSISFSQGFKLGDDLLNNKFKLAAFIAENKSTEKKVSDRLKRFKSNVTKNINIQTIKPLESELDNKSKTILNDLVASNYIPNQDDMSSSEAVVNFKKAVGSNPESERWTKPLSKIESPEKFKNRDKSNDRSGPDI